MISTNLSDVYLHRTMESSAASAHRGSEKKNQYLPVGLLGFSVSLLFLCSCVCLITQEKENEDLKHVNKNFVYFFLLTSLWVMEYFTNCK